jgi:predicted nucleic-acid-binding protein
LRDVYEYSREQIAEAIEGLLGTSQLQAANPAAVSTAVQRYRASSADFADCLLGAVNVKDGCEYTVTFDRKASKLPEFRSITS